jgi:class 3 adenylate cyclase
MRSIDRLNAVRAQMGKPTVTIDLALHLGEVLYGNVGAIDRLDFTVIGPAVNEVSRIETLCEPLDRRVLVSAVLAAAIRDKTRLESLAIAFEQIPARFISGSSKSFGLVRPHAQLVQHPPPPSLTLSLTKSPDALGTDALPRDLGGSGPLYANRPPFFSSSN